MHRGRPIREHYQEEKWLHYQEDIRLPLIPRYTRGRPRHSIPVHHQDDYRLIPVTRNITPTFPLSRPYHIPFNFRLFKRLPHELRALIWNMSMPTSRVVEIQGHDRGYICATRTNPIQLSICQESRHEALRKYQLAFGSPLVPPRTFFDFENDVLFLSRRYFSSRVDLFGLLTWMTDLEKVRKLALENSGPGQILRIIEPLRRFEKLSRLFCVFLRVGRTDVRRRLGLTVLRGPAMSRTYRGLRRSNKRIRDGHASFHPAAIYFEPRAQIRRYHLPH